MIADNSRFRTLNAGRRFGKSLLGAYLGTYELLKPNRRIWVVAPTNSLTEKIWRELLPWFGLPGGPLCTVTKQIYRAKGNWRIVTKHNSFLECKSADDPTSLIGEGLDLLIMDEASRVKTIAWEQSLRPTLSDRLGKAVFISTPRGKGTWYHKQYLKGLDGGNCSSWSLPSNANPYFPKSEWDEVLKEFGADSPVFQQEYMAQFIDDAGAVFRNIRACIGGEFKEPEKDVRYVMGTDLAKVSDWTVSFVMRADTRQIVAYDRFQGISYDMQIPRIGNLSKKYNNAMVLVDSTGVGDPVYDLLRATGVNARPFKFTNPSKENLVRGLMIALENKEVSYPEIPVLINELEAFEYTVGSTGLMRYNAPQGYHDDCVIALGLVVCAASSGKSGVLDYYKELYNEPIKTEQNNRQVFRATDYSKGYGDNIEQLG